MPRGSQRDRRRKIGGAMAPRPKLDVGTARDQSLLVRLRADELAAWRRTAEIRRISVSDLVRDAVNAEISRPGRPAKNPKLG